jgi:AraC-like DNA-binding protein
MKLIETSPFVRFAYKVRLKSGSPSVASDMRLFYVIDGEGSIIVDGAKHSFSPGTVMVWQAGVSYTLSSETLTSVISINFDYTADDASHTMPYPVLDATKKESFQGITPIFFEDCPVFNKPIICTANSLIFSILERIIFENTSCQPFYRERTSALLKECLVLIARNVSTSSDARSDSAIDRVLEYIHKNYASNVDNFTLAKIAGYHPYYLSKLFLALNGITLHKYVSNYRIAVSEQLLLSTTASVDEIALKVGFSCALSFSSSFKKKNGMTPTEFRKRFGFTI